MRLYTAKGDDGTTGLLFGGRVPKDSPRPEACGATDEAQAAIGVARAELTSDHADWDPMLVQVERHLYVLMAELATEPGNRDKLTPGTTLVDDDMLRWLTGTTDEIAEQLEIPREFVIPGGNRLSAALDVARTAVRTAERRAVAATEPGSLVLPYLNRLSSLLWALARLAEERHVEAKQSPS